MREEEKLKIFIKEMGRKEAPSGFEDTIMSMVTEGQEKTFVYQPVISKHVLWSIIGGIGLLFLGVILFSDQSAGATPLWLEAVMQLEAFGGGFKLLDGTKLNGSLTPTFLSPIYGYALVTLAMALILIPKLNLVFNR